MFLLALFSILAACDPTTEKTPRSKSGVPSIKEVAIAVTVAIALIFFTVLILCIKQPKEDSDGTLHQGEANMGTALLDKKVL